MSIGFSKRIRKCILDYLRIDKIAAKLGFLEEKIIVRIDGGLASQMHQFSLGYAVAKQTGLPVYYDISFFEEDGCDIKGIKNRYFWLLHTFPRIRQMYANRFISGRQISKRFKKWFSDALIVRQVPDFSTELFEKRSWYIKQYYSNAGYTKMYENELRQLFEFDLALEEKESEWKQHIVSSESCFVHIRKGDFVGSVHEVCTDKYYLNAIKKMNSIHQDATFFIFSNDESYAYKLLTLAEIPDKRICFINGRSEIDPRVDLYLMSLCRHAIISNRGFSWFPAFLAKHNEQVVIMPEYWTADAKLKEHSRLSYHQDGWIIMPV